VIISALKKITVVLFFGLIISIPVFSLDFDTSVDDEIRKNYNPSKLELESLPPLPKVAPSKPQSKSVTKPVNNLPQITTPSQKPVIAQIDRSNANILGSGTKFTVKSNQGLSDSMRAGTRISFSLKKQLDYKIFTIPQGTVFKGEIVDSHNPQITGNGGLLVIKIDSMTYKGLNVGISAKITKANNKKIFVNNIKGKRSYWKNVTNQVDKGQKFYNKTRRASNKLANNPIGAFVSPVPVIFGAGVYAVNLVGSPIVSVFKNGGKISIPAGTEFEIKLTEDAYLP